MRYLLALILATVFVFGGVYLVISFTKWDFIPFSEWEESQRAFYMFFCILMTAVVSAFFMGIADEIGRKK